MILKVIFIVKYKSLSNISGKKRIILNEE